MNHAESRRDRTALQRRDSAVVEIRLPTSRDPDQTERSTPFAVSAVDAARVLAELAVERANLTDFETAHAALDDALLLLDAVEDPRAAARIWVIAGEALLAMQDPHRAHERFEAAFTVLDSRGDVTGAARALFGVARALRTLGDDACRAAFEDAGMLFEDVDDEPMVRAIERILRELEAEAEASAPRSLPSSPRIPLRPISGSPPR